MQNATQNVTPSAPKEGSAIQTEPTAPTIDEQETAGSGMTANDLWDIQERDIFEATHQGKGSTAEDF